MASVIMAAFCHPRPTGGRFNSSERGAWYAASSLAGRTCRGRLSSHHRVGGNRRVRNARADAPLPGRFPHRVPRRVGQHAGECLLPRPHELRGRPGSRTHTSGARVERPDLSQRAPPGRPMPRLLSLRPGGERARRRPLRISLARHAHAANPSLEQGYFITCVLQLQPDNS